MTDPTLDEFLNLFDGIAERARLERTARYVVRRASDRTLPPHELETRWYRELDDFPDYSVYNDPDYLGEVWASWRAYSRRYVRDVLRLAADGLFDGTRSLVDVGAGIGYTTLALSERWASTATNVPGIQADAARRLGVDVIDDGTAPCADILFASEYLEHFWSPVRELSRLLDAIEPTYVIAASTFGSPSVGHFPWYYVNDEPTSGALTSRRVNDELRRRGFARVETGLWNNRPAVWRRVSQGETR